MKSVRTLATIALIAAACAPPLTPLAAQVLTPVQVTPPAPKPVVLQALKPGDVSIVVQYVDPITGKIIKNALVFTVIPVPISTIQLLNAFSPPRWIDTVVVGHNFCVFATARDSAGNVLTGRHVTFASSDTLTVRIVNSNTAIPGGGTTGPLCPASDTSIDPLKVLVNPLPPAHDLSSILNVTFDNVLTRAAPKPRR